MRLYATKTGDGVKLFDVDTADDVKLYDIETSEGVRLCLFPNSFTSLASAFPPILDSF